MDLRSLVPFQWGRSNNTAPARYEDPFTALHRQMDRLFDDFHRGMPAMRWSGVADAVEMKLDVAETDKEIKVTAELPGVDEKDIDITLTGDLLTIKGEKKIEEERKNDNYHVVERSYGSFQRSLRLPFLAGDKDVSAEFKNGVLTVAIVKPAEAQSTVKKIGVKAK